MSMCSRVGESLPSGYITCAQIPALLLPSCPGLGCDSLLGGVRQAGEHLILLLDGLCSAFPLGVSSHGSMFMCCWSGSQGCAHGWVNALPLSNTLALIPFKLGKAESAFYFCPTSQWTRAVSTWGYSAEWVELNPGPFHCRLGNLEQLT